MDIHIALSLLPDGVVVVVKVQCRDVWLATTQPHTHTHIYRVNPNPTPSFSVT